MNLLPLAKKAAIVKALTEGSSIRATARMTGTSKTTVQKTLEGVGEFCSAFQNFALRDLPCKRVEADEIWAFVGAKAKNAKTEGFGDVWTFVAIDADTKLIVSWLVGQRFKGHAEIFMKDLASRMAGRIQLTTDGHAMYRSAVARAFKYDVDYSQLVKQYAPQEGGTHRYSPPVCIGATKTWIMGKPLEPLVTTSYVERANLTMRMQMRRFTRLTNGFSRKIENHAHAVALHFFVSNFCRAHMTLTKKANGVHTTPAMATGLTDHAWTIERMLAMMDPEKPIA